MHERLLPIIGGYSFANVVHSGTVGALSTENRFQLLELIYQHLQAIGMCNTAEILAEESGHEFQSSNQPWERTDLLLITSLAISNREDPWEVPPLSWGASSHQYFSESIEEDVFSSPYREDPSKIWEEFFDPTLNAEFTTNSQDPKDLSFDNIKHASLRQLVASLVRTTALRKGSPKPSDESSELFFLTLHSITSAEHFLQMLVVLFDEADQRQEEGFT